MPAKGCAAVDFVHPQAGRRSAPVLRSKLAPAIAGEISLGKYRSVLSFDFGGHTWMESSVKACFTGRLRYERIEAYPLLTPHLPKRRAETKLM